MSTQAAEPDPVATFLPHQAPTVTTESDPTLEFGVESEPAASAAPTNSRRTTIVAGSILTAIAILGLVWISLRQGAPSLVDGSLRIESDPPGAEVRIDGTTRGVTPLSLSLPAGPYTVVVQQGSSVKELPVTVQSGAAAAYHVAWATSAPATSAQPTGSLYIASDTPGSTVRVDGADRGRTPLTVSGLTPGRHEVAVRSDNATYRRTIEIEAGTTASLMIGGTGAAAAWGWVDLNSPIPLRVMEEGRVIGTSDLDRIMLPPGTHQLELISDTYGFRQTQTVRIAAGRGGVVAPTLPEVGLNINASPWAEVFINGTRVGDTPLANVKLPLGDHEVVFRHPQLGERRQVARVSLLESPRVVADMRAR